MLNETVFSFDFDNTISRDPEGFLGVMELLEKRGHTVYVVTARRPEIHPEDFDFLLKKGYKVFFTRHISKLKWMEEVEKIHVDVWVDDCPDAVLNNFHGEPRTHRDMVPVTNGTTKVVRQAPSFFGLFTDEEHLEYIKNHARFLNNFDKNDFEQRFKDHQAQQLIGN